MVKIEKQKYKSKGEFFLRKFNEIQTVFFVESVTMKKHLISN